jgi:hypothetical protein
MGRVLDLLTGDDGKTRCVRVLRGSDSTEGIYSINHLYPLELSLSDVEYEGQQAQVDLAPLPRTQPVRAAAVRCKERLRSGN